MSEKVAFIGLGEMGLGMASNLIKSGYQVFGFDSKQVVCNEASKKGVIVCGSIREAAESSDNVVISVVRDYNQTEKVIFGENGIVSSGDKKLTIIVMSTLDPHALKQLAVKVEEVGYVLIDAPVSGAKARADGGDLTIMTAGKKETVDLCHPYFRAMGKNIFYFGTKIGLAQAAKLSNNLMLAINMIGCTEGLKFSNSFDLPSDEMLELLKVSSGNSWVVQNWEVVRKWWEEYEPNETLDIVHKDLFSIQKLCFEKKISLPLSGLTFGCFLNALEREDQDLR